MKMKRRTHDDEGDGGDDTAMTTKRKTRHRHDVGTLVNICVCCSEHSLQLL